MVRRRALWQHSLMMAQPRDRHHWTFCVAALGLWVAYGWPVTGAYVRGEMIRDAYVSPLFFIPFAVMGIAITATMLLKLQPRLHWALLWVQLGAVVAMTLVVSWAGISSFLVIIAWQVGMSTTARKAIGWVAFQNLAVVVALAQALNPDLCWVLTKSTALQLLFVFTAQALRREADTARALAQTNRELRSAQAVIANAARNAERLRISRDLHDAWGHELTALGLQLEIASNVSEPTKANEHVLHAKGLARGLLGKVRDVVSTLRVDEHEDLREALQVLARSVPKPAVHVEIAPEVRVSPDQAHTLMRCAQEAVTNAVRHADASNLWLRVTQDGDGVSLVASNDGKARPAASTPGHGLVGMRERVEALGGRLAVQAGAGLGFTIEAWLPSVTPRSA